MIFKMLSRRAGKTAAARDAAYKKTMRSLVYGERTPAEILAALGRWYRDADRGTIDAVRDFRAVCSACDVDAEGRPVFLPDPLPPLKTQINFRYITNPDRARRLIDSVRAAGAGW